MSSEGAVLAGNNTIIARVPAECYDYIKSYMEDYFPDGSYDLDKCICEPGTIHSECMKKAEEITPFARISAPQRDENSISFIASWHRGDAKAAQPVAALYDEEGRLIGIQKLPETDANDRAAVTFSLSETGITGPCSVKVFLLEDLLSIYPICGFEEVTFPALTSSN